MSPTVIALALAAALLHATWNAFLRTGADRLWTVTVMSVPGIVLGLPLLAVLPWPAGPAWPHILASAALQVVYSLGLVAAYRQGELGQVYPIVRGSVPVLVTLGTFLVTGFAPLPVQLAGIGLVTLGILSLSVGAGRASGRSILFALGTAAIIATYATVDALGVRKAGHSVSYALWVMAIWAAMQVATYVALRRGLALDLRARITWTALTGGVVAMVSYGLAIAAYALGPAGPVAALRESSVVFAVLIGWLALGERLTPRRFMSCLLVLGGALLIGR